MVTLKNDNLQLEISETGAEIRRLLLNGVDQFWSGDPKYWSGVAPVLFPICGGLKDDKFTFQGKEYILEKHGFAKLMDFSVEKRTDLSATFLLTDTPETLRKYPFRFEFRITYSLRGRTVDIEYNVKNNSETVMYMSVGSHEAYACPEGIEDYDIIFPQRETLNACALDGNLLAHSTVPVIKDTNVLPLYEKYFEIDALVFKDLKSRSATLRNRKTGRSITVEFPGCNYFLLWQKAGAKYICLEPWSGIPAMNDAGIAIEEKTNY